eukprot:1193935-Prorocentrum_minimum.AAC.3
MERRSSHSYLSLELRLELLQGGLGLPQLDLQRRRLGEQRVALLPGGVERRRFARELLRELLLRRLRRRPRHLRLRHSRPQRLALRAHLPGRGGGRSEVRAEPEGGQKGARGELEGS